MKQPLCSAVGFIVFSIVMLYATIASVQESKAPAALHAPVPLPGVEPEMLSADYWISLHNDADEIISTPAEITAWNSRLRSKVIDLSDKHGRKNPLLRSYDLKRQVGLFMHPVLPLELTATVPGDSLKTWIGANLDWLRSRYFYDYRRVRFDEKMIGELEESMNLSAIPETISRRYGVIIGRSAIRLFPTSNPGHMSTRSASDNFQNTSIYMTAPVTILHESLDGDYYYVESPVARGWIASKNVATATKAGIKDYLGADDILMSTANKVPVYGDRSCRSFRQYLYFSGNVPFVRKYNGGYVVKMPERSRDGSLSAVECYLKADADVSIGYLPYTKRNVATQIFKLLYQPYGWADMMNNRDCSGTMRVLFRCFGFTMGRWPNFLLLAPSDEDIHYVDKELSEEEKIADVKNIEPFMTVTGSGGHIALWLGRGHNGKYYFMHQGGWSYKEGDQQYYVNQVNLNDVTHKWYNIGQTPVFSTIK